ncbi:MAG TPA: nuclear transport factor 2 family protein [Gammaproteobacteria bacterium]|nr:nuclear transport factor 2 family protein [Gammaproteobacteria bacterium]
MNIVKSNRFGILVAALVATASVSAQSLTADDKAAIQALSASYAQALSGCKAEEFADLFVPVTGAFASGFRGRMVGREKLILLVQSERHCTGEVPSRPSGNAPAVAIESTASGVRGVVSLGAAEYQDEYAKTSKGWRFASRTVIIGAEKAAGLDASGMLAIQNLGGANLGDFYAPDPKGVSRLLTSGVRITAKDDEVTGRAFLKDGSYDDVVYERTDAGQWRVKSSAHVAR